MPARHLVIGFSICLGVGMVLALIVAAVLVVLGLPHEVLADSKDLDYLRPMLIGATGFAAVCAVARSRAVSSRKRVA